MLSPGVVVEKGAVVESAVGLNGAAIRAGARVERAIVDLHAEVAGGARVGDGSGPESITVFAAATEDGEDAL